MGNKASLKDPLKYWTSFSQNYISKSVVVPYGPMIVSDSNTIVL